jgi:lipopolysaccharide export system protein LptA
MSRKPFVSPGTMLVAVDVYVLNRNPEDGSIQSIVASQNARIHFQGEGRSIAATGETIRLADLDAEEPRLILTGDPGWTSDRDSGRADVLRALLKSDRFEAEGNASMTLQPTLGRGPGARDGEFEWLRAREEPVRIQADSYTVEREQALFLGGASTHHPNWTLTSQTLAMEFTPDHFEIRQITARDQVRFEHKGASASSVDSSMETSSPRAS